MKFVAFSAIFLFVLVAANAEEDKFVPIQYKSCKSLFEVISVESTICPLDDEDRCIFTHEDTPKIRIGFKPDRDVTALKTQVRARLDDKYISFHLENDDACKDQNITCPLKAGQTYFYSQTVTIVREYPAIEVMVNWLLNDPSLLEEKKEPYFNEDGERIKNDLCVVFLAKVSEKQ